MPLPAKAYKQKISVDSLLDLKKGESFFLTCLVTYNGESLTVILRNLKTSSTLYCRLLRLKLEKESTILINIEECCDINWYVTSNTQQN